MPHEVTAISSQIVQKNIDAIQDSKVITACACGIVSGALGLVHIHGFILMAVMYLIISGLLFIRVLPNTKEWFEGSYVVLTEAFFPFIMSFIFMWTVAYSLVYIY
ncbi:hypothetical protein EIN_056370 [Entamoeba invadens IP1]|uniref:hypothetical protein n=1 Tax=Entamoeba invadens IP1 TaxID=370355 RepID=UPI0002C3ECE9|nr:hypothetical protein EIN_056370 [Entamoeba invadens IP1]ELP93262.1 hypothetical protein EIN_056370 [Entamoeba invadens IP1]|eukprot:XP_004260033.1 hypothetical protein EIN_056370 [Entamoeba invadens IP1]